MYRFIGNMLQLIRKPDRDWNISLGLLMVRRRLLLQLIRKPDRDWNNFFCWKRVLTVSYNSLENPIGIETDDISAIQLSTDNVTTH